MEEQELFVDSDCRLFASYEKRIPGPLALIRFSIMPKQGEVDRLVEFAVSRYEDFHMSFLHQSINSRCSTYVWQAVLPHLEFLIPDNGMLYIRAEAETIVVYRRPGPDGKYSYKLPEIDIDEWYQEWEDYNGY